MTDTTNRRRSITGPTRTSGVAPISLADLSRRTAELWRHEPRVPSPQRSRLLGELNDLEHEVDGLLLRSGSGLDVPARLVRRCAERYLWLREQWGHEDVAA